MKKLLCALLSAAMLTGCAAPAVQTTPTQSAADDPVAVSWMLEKGGLEISVPGGMAENAITATEADGHTVVRISAPGTYILSGRLEAGQIAVDLGEDAKNDPGAVVTLVLDGVDITCANAPAILFYQVYESGEPGGADGANVVLAQGSVNSVTGSHTEEYDGALYSRMSMTIGGEGTLSICGDNEGLCSELHLTVNSGDISIESGNDGINANADGESVVTVSGGRLRITVTGGTGEGDGIDSNGSIVISGGTVEAYACGSSMDSGIDADLGITISGGTVIATGNMLDAIEESSQTHAVFSFAQTQKGGSYALKTENGTALLEADTPNAFTNLLLSCPELTEGNYTLFSGDTQFEGTATQGGGFFQGPQPIEGIDRPGWPGSGGDVEIPPQPTTPVVTQGTVQPPQGEQPENMPVPDFSQGFDPGQMPNAQFPGSQGNMPVPELPEGVEPGGSGSQSVTVIPGTGAISELFPIVRGANYFYMVQPAA